MIFVYINEAHATDIWNIGESAGAIINNHKTIGDRISAATNFKKMHNFAMDVYCDNMNNDFENKFSSWPARYFVFCNNKIKIIAEPKDSHFSMIDLFEFLAKL